MISVLMFGWELPTLHSGTLGVTCKRVLARLKTVGGPKIYFDLPANPQGPATFIGDAVFADLALDGAPVWTSYRSDILTQVKNYRDNISTLSPYLEYSRISRAHDWLGLMHGMRAKKLTGKPLVAHLHSTEIDRNGSHFSKEVFDIENVGMDSVDRIIAVSEYTRQHIARSYHQDLERIEVVHKAHTFQPSEAEAGKRGKQVSRVTFIARITSKKDPEMFVRAARLVLDAYQDATFVLSGDGDLLSSCKMLVERLGLSNSFEFLRFLSCDAVQRLLDDSDVLPRSHRRYRR